MRPLLACCLVICGHLAARADDDSAAHFLVQCNSLSKDMRSWRDDAAAGYATGSDTGYCLGTMIAVLNLGPELSEDLRFCPPAKRVIVGIGVMAGYLRAHPDRKNELYLPLMVEAFQHEWPCK